MLPGSALTIACARLRSESLTTSRRFAYARPWFFPALLHSDIVSLALAELLLGRSSRQALVSRDSETGVAKAEIDGTGSAEAGGTKEAPKPIIINL